MNRPCIRGLSQFKKGCPETTFDKRTGDGCPAWKEYYHKKPGQDPVLVAADCIDCLKERWSHEALKLLESNYAITESLRNGMCETGPDDKTRPKTSHGTIAVASMLQQIINQQKLFLDVNDNNFREI